MYEDGAPITSRTTTTIGDPLLEVGFSIHRLCGRLTFDSEEE